MAFKYIVGKEKMLGTSILSFPTMFSTLSMTDLPIWVAFNLSSAKLMQMLVWTRLKLWPLVEFNK